MNPPDKPDNGQFESPSDQERTLSKRVRVDEVLADLRAGLRTKGFLAKYGLSMPEFEYLLKKLIRKGLFTKDEFTAWKARRPSPSTEPQEYRTGQESAAAAERDPSRQGIVTYVIKDPEKNDTWALQLFSTQRDQIQGRSFKVNLHGRKYSFVVEELIFRGPVSMLTSVDRSGPESRGKREKAIEFISAHGWAAYLESRAIEANVDDSENGVTHRARLVLLRCRNNTFLAALHTPAPTINLYVGPSLENIKQRLAKSVDTRTLGI